ncbi:ankyrin repeat-containing domain protein [Apiospora marii]|uniref:Ankyrin repeat-containing domain protein n=1 Tax=Apiospora marii TaxID=335849 RepID=A0ABR1R4F6_9PEZI
MPEPPSPTALRKMSPTDWENYRDLISRWYITENKTVPGIIKELKGSEHGFSVAQYELKDHIAIWGLRKNFARREQECLVAQRKRSRREAEGTTYEYTFAGQSISEERIKRLEYRLDHPIMVWGRQTRDLVVSQSNLLALQHNQIYEWRPWKDTPHQLPCISFIRNTPLLDSISHALFGGSSRQFVASSDSRHMLQSNSVQLGFGSSSIDKLAMSFSCLMPESREGENMARAKSLVRTRGELDMEMLKVVFFQLSNNFIGEEDYGQIVRLAERFGFGNPSIIRALFSVATKDLTIAAILDKLFIAACETSALELVEVLIQENKEVKDGQSVRVLAFDLMPALVVSDSKSGLSQTEPVVGRFPAALHHAIFLGHRQIVDILIKFKADVNQLCDHFTMHECSWAWKVCWWCNSDPYQAHRDGFICSMDKRAINAFNIATNRGYFQNLYGWLVDDDAAGFDYLEPWRLGMDRYATHFFPAGFRIDAKPEYLSLAVEGGSAQVLRYLLRALKATYSSGTSELTKALQIALESGFADGVDIFIGEGVQLPPNWWVYVFATYQSDSLHSILERMQLTQDMMGQKRQDGCSGLEAAMRNPHLGVASIALGRFPQAYDSGALLARLCKCLGATESSPDAQLDELVKRRETVDERDFTPVLENAAIALAAYFAMDDLLSALLRRPQPQAPALVPGPDLWDSRSCKTSPNCLCSITIASSLRHLSRAYLANWRWWHFDHSPRKTSPIFMAVKGVNPKAIDQLILKGYEIDLPTTIATLNWPEPIVVMQKLLETWKNRENELRIWESCAHYVKFIIRKGCLKVLKLLTNHEPNIGNLYYNTIDISRTLIDSPRTALQLAISVDQASDDVAHYLIKKGADVTAPAYPDMGLSALQAAAMKGKIALARYLIIKGAQINEPRAPVCGRTSLEAAAEAGRLNMVQFLLNVGTETKGKYRVQYLRAMQLARYKRHAAVEKLLRRHRDQDLQDDILSSQNITPNELGKGDGISGVFLHPNEASFEERRCLRQWCFENEMKPPRDAELELLSSEELELPCQERMEILAAILGHRSEMKRRMQPLVDKVLGKYNLPPPLGHGIGLLVATEVEILRRDMPPATPSTEYSSSDDEGESDESSILYSDEDIGDVSPHEEAIEEDEESPVHEVVGAGDDIGPRMQFHPEFNRRRDSVDFHETIHKDFLI